jgi:hypothetical protein
MIGWSTIFSRHSQKTVYIVAAYDCAFVAGFMPVLVASSWIE